jgi:ketopantoate reductase
VETAPDLTEARWDKLIWNIPFGCLSVLLDAGTAGWIANPKSRQLIIELMYEVIEGARSCGYDLDHDYPNKLIAMTAALPDYQPSIYVDHARHSSDGTRCVLCRTRWRECKRPAARCPGSRLSIAPCALWMLAT